MICDFVLMLCTSILCESDVPLICVRIESSLGVHRPGGPRGRVWASRLARRVRGQHLRQPGAQHRGAAAGHRRRPHHSRPVPGVVQGDLASAQSPHELETCGERSDSCCSIPGAVVPVHNIMLHQRLSCACCAYICSARTMHCRRRLCWRRRWQSCGRQASPARRLPISRIWRRTTPMAASQMPPWQVSHACAHGTYCSVC